MKRGEIWTQAGGPEYAGKPRPTLIVQSNQLDGTESIITCLFTSHLDDRAVPSRVRFNPTPGNGLRNASWLMADKVMAIPRHKLGRKVGELLPEDMEKVECALMVALGFAG